jgi:hypothetical protein
MLLIFNNNLDLPETKYIEAGSDIKKRDYTGTGSRAILPNIISCNQGLDSITQTEELEEYIERN